jgi:hypothetical protein
MSMWRLRWVVGVSTVALLGVSAAAQSAQSPQKSKEGSVNERPANRAAATFFVAARCEVANWLWWTVESGQRKSTPPPGCGE